MLEFLNSLAAWISSTEFSMWIGRSHTRIAWLFTLHLFGLVFLLGGITFLSLRLLGLVMSRSPVRQLARSVLPIVTTGLIVMVASGLIIFIGGAESYYAGFWFRLKMVLLFAAIVFHFAVFRRVVIADDDRLSRLVQQGTAVAEILIWFSVGCAGRAIAFF